MLERMVLILTIVALFAGTMADAGDRLHIDQAVVFGTHKSAYSIVNGYDQSLSGSGSSGSGFSGSGGSRAQNYNIKNFLTIGYSASSKTLENSYVSILAETMLSFSVAEILLPDGIGIFIEPVSLNSYSVEVEPRILLSNQIFKEHMTVKIGYGLAFVKSRDKFQLGSWNFNENLNVVDSNLIISLEKQVRQTFKPTVFLEFKKFENADHIWAGFKTEY